jgi:hypothetical protein
LGEVDLVLQAMEEREDEGYRLELLSEVVQIWVQEDVL